MRAYFDTETSGLPLWREPSENPRQPFLVEFAAILEDEDEERGRFHWIVAPPVEREIPQEASDIHGITTELANRFGVPRSIPCDLFMSLVRLLDGGELVAHNIKFDLRVMKIALLGIGIDREEVDALMDKINPVCTMDLATPILNLPPTQKMVAAGFNKPKSPSLEECYQHFFGAKLEGAHRSLVDVETCRKIHRLILNSGGSR